jgi:2-polyprenyl-6-methoxyphenol hydroxylase-like FAD-dependent oxidoreductase
VEYLFGDSIKALSDDGDGLDVSFKSGLNAASIFVIAADGQRSSVRNLAFGEQAQGNHERAFGAYEAALKPLVEAAQKQIGHTGPSRSPRRGSVCGCFVPLAVSLLTITAWAWKGVLSRKPSSQIRDY